MASPLRRASAAWIERHERRPLPARPHIVAAEIVHHADPEPLSQRRTVADLVGAPGIRLVADRVAGEANQRDILPAHAGLGQQGPGEIGVEFGQRVLSRLARATPFDHRP